SQWRTDIQSSKEEGMATPSLRIVKVGAPLPKALPNYRLAPLTTSRSVAKVGQKITFRSALHLDNFATYMPPKSVTLEIDGKKVHDFLLPTDAKLGTPIPLQLTHTFKSAGKHTVAIKVDVDPALDALAADNTQRVAQVVRDWPILLLDGDDKLS